MRSSRGRRKGRQNVVRQRFSVLVLPLSASWLSCPALLLHVERRCRRGHAGGELHDHGRCWTGAGTGFSCVCCCCCASIASACSSLLGLLDSRVLDWLLVACHGCLGHGVTAGGQLHCPEVGVGLCSSMQSSGQCNRTSPNNPKVLCPAAGPVHPRARPVHAVPRLRFTATAYSTPKQSAAVSSSGASAPSSTEAQPYRSATPVQWPEPSAPPDTRGMPCTPSLKWFSITVGAGKRLWCFETPNLELEPRRGVADV